MIRKIKTLTLSLVMATSFVLPAAMPATVMAVDPSDANAKIQDSLCGGATELKFNPSSGQCEKGPSETNFNNILKRVINIISIIVGVVAVIMIIIGGFRYIVSGGTQEKVTSAKNTILYGLIGLIIVALAQVIVRFVLRETTGSVT